MGLCCDKYGPHEYEGEAPSAPPAAAVGAGGAGTGALAAPPSAPDPAFYAAPDGRA